MIVSFEYLPFQKQGLIAFLQPTELPVISQTTKEIKQLKEKTKKELE